MIKSVTINKALIESCEEVSFLLPQIHQELIDLSYLYPGFKNWYEHKVLPGVFAGERSLLIELRDDVLAGIAIIKNDGLEKKLCCLRVVSDFQKKGGVGLKLFERSMEELGTQYPLLSVSNDRAQDFEKIFRYFGFKKSWEYPDLYRPHKIEFSFNGLIMPSQELTKRDLSIRDRTSKVLRFSLPPTTKAFANFLS